MLIATNVRKEYAGARPIVVLDDLSLDVKPGQSVAIMGPSGSGKSTLLYLLGALDKPSGGSIRINDVDPYALNEREQAAFRGRHVGFVFQDHLLLPQLTALDNVLVPTLPAGGTESTSALESRARALLDAVGLTERADHRPAALSGGERQRVAIARALIRQPSLLLCDEPTGNLDRASADAVADLLLSLHAEQNTMLVAVTHSPAFAARFQRRCELQERRLVPMDR
jgi:lipoprotein-releasing system ATP-binding protein